MKACLVVVLSLVILVNTIMIPVARAESAVGTVECLIASLMQNSTYLAIRESLSREGTMLIDPRVAHRGNVDIIAFSTNNPDLSTVLVVVDAARQVRDMVAVQRGGMQSGNEVSASSATDGITAVSLLTGVAKEVVTASPELEGVHVGSLVVMFGVVLWQTTQWMVLYQVGLHSWQAAMVLSIAWGTALAYIDHHGNICPNVVWKFHTEQITLGHSVVHVCPHTGLVTVP
ncbi:MAG: hypothetical protein KGZ92_09685 [Firmicutes bacterium]|nr:hypothetical protein [Dethiobacter sp.]MBS3889533.1 hypothetical protein [Bacillota bacterium]MBS4053975.1 hypothetical protein [Thermaerobacter sp.]